MADKYATVNQTFIGGMFDMVKCKVLFTPRLGWNTIPREELKQPTSLQVKNK